MGRLRLLVCIPALLACVGACSGDGSSAVPTAVTGTDTSTSSAPAPPPPSSTTPRATPTTTTTTTTLPPWPDDIVGPFTDACVGIVDVDSCACVLDGARATMSGPEFVDMAGDLAAGGPIPDRLVELVDDCR